MTVEENKKIVQKEVKDFFEGAKAERHPPPEEKVDPVKAKRTIDALRKPPKSLQRTNYQRVTEQTYLEAQRSGSTVSDKRLKERAAGKKCLARRTRKAIVPPAQCV